MDASLYFVALVFAVLLAVCWVVLPFAVIGVKPLLRDLLREQKRTNDLLEGRNSPAHSERQPDRTFPGAVMGRNDR